jgi:microcystin-dependent protein
MDTYIGTILLFAFNYAPEGWLPCNGNQLRVIEYQALFSLLGPTYGGDGKTTFALPNLTGKEPIPGLAYYICVQGTYPPRP